MLEGEGGEVLNCKLSRCAEGEGGEVLKLSRCAEG